MAAALTAAARAMTSTAQGAEATKLGWSMWPTFEESHAIEASINDRIEVSVGSTAIQCGFTHRVQLPFPVAASYVEATEAGGSQAKKTYLNRFQMLHGGYPGYLDSTTRRCAKFYITIIFTRFSFVL